jgi:hypothetical protein
MQKNTLSGKYLPQYTFGEYHETVVNCQIQNVYDVACNVDLSKSKLIKIMSQFQNVSFEVCAYLGQAQGGSKISTAGILGVFRGLKFSTNAEIGRDKRRLRMECFEAGSIIQTSGVARKKNEHAVKKTA